ncbi:MAG TPA: pyridoxamine 5'-phosphate oxidase family protein, partial [candidate division Zixibacteria bacterium]|nr:pyridoxamine 5'-phosphate oxidase family protein [candidate division Zixibacteria bacterium]
MRRKDREITNPTVIAEIIRKAEVCHIGLCDEGEPYVLPVNFGYRDRIIYIHCAHEGRKLDIIRRNPRVCAVFDIDHELVRGEEAVKWSWKYRSVIAFGTAEILADDDLTGKTEALDILMSQYSDKSWTYPEKTLLRTGIIRITIDRMTGKAHE